MDYEKEKHVVTDKQGLGASSRETDPGSKMHDLGAESWDKAKRELGHVYDKTGKTMHQTFDRAKSYSCEKPGTTVLIALGIGLGLGFALGATIRHSRRNQFVEPVAYALSDVVQKVFR